MTKGSEKIILHKLLYGTHIDNNFSEREEGS